MTNKLNRPKTMPSLEDFEWAARRLVAEGRIRDTGRRRDGMIVYEETELGRAQNAADRAGAKH